MIILSPQRRMTIIDGLGGLLMQHAGRVGAAIAAYLLRATFDADDQGFADGQVLDTEAEGVQDGQLTVVEVDGTLAIVSNECAFTAQLTVTWGDQGFYSQAIARALGRGLLLVTNFAQNTKEMEFGIRTDASVALAGRMYGVYTNFTSATFRLQTIAVPNELIVAASYVAVTDYNIAIVLGGYDVNLVPWHSGAAGTFDYGAAWYIKGGAFATWTLLWRTRHHNTATLYAYMTNYDQSGIIDSFRVPDVDLSAVLQPLVKDTFTAANGVSLDAITPEVAGPWTERTGNFDIQTNRANISATTGVRDVATVPATAADLFARTTIRKTVAADSGEFGHCLRWTDDDNFWMVHGDLAANQIEIVERNGGVETQRGATAVALTHSTDYDLVAIADAQDITGWVKPSVETRVTYAAASLNEAVAVHGIVGNEVGQTFDNYAQNARTAAIYDATLNSV